MRGILPHLDSYQREQVARDLLTEIQRKQQLAIAKEAPPLRTPYEKLAGVNIQYPKPERRDHSMAPHTPAEHLKELAETAAAMKEVAEYFTAQEAMDLFQHNPQAKHIFTAVIREGLMAVFHSAHKGGYPI